MNLDIKKFVVRPHEVRAIRITEVNMTEVAKWCKGEIQTEIVGVDGNILKGDIPEGTEIEQRVFIKARVFRTLNERQSKGYVGDWILKRKGQFKVYTDKAFSESYMDDPDSIPMHSTVGDIDTGSVYETMVAERTKPAKETFLAVSGHEQVFVTPAQGVPMRGVPRTPNIAPSEDVRAVDSEVQFSPVTPPDGVPSFVRKDEATMSEEERDAYYEKLEARYKKDTGGGRVIITVEPSASPFFSDATDALEVPTSDA